jgi:mediator of RNA polymerase II transcription subunit 5
MDSRTIARGVQQAGLDQWAKFISRCIATRLDFDKFESYVPFVQSKHPLPPTVIADLFLRPQASNNDSLDPRIHRYLQTLANLKYVDTPSILKALYKYSTSHSQCQSAPLNPGAEPSKPVTRWRSSYAAEEVIFYRLTKAVAQGVAIQTTRDALELAKIMAKWIALFTSASIAFAADVMGNLESPQAKDDMESARAAFVALLLGVCENQVVLKTMSRRFAKGEYFYTRYADLPPK